MLDLKNIDTINFSLKFFSEEECISIKEVEKKNISESLINKIFYFIHKLNQAKYDFEISFSSKIFIMSLDAEKKDSNEWSFDIEGVGDESTRKLTFIIFLDHKKIFTGGELEFFPSNQKFSGEIGDIIVFPSFSSYKFNQIKSGTSKVAIGWIHGPSFK
jgi:hypothetical protein